MENGSIEIGKLIEWCKLSRREQNAQKCNNPFNDIPNYEGIYKIYIEDKDKGVIKFGSIVMVKNTLSIKAHPRLPDVLEKIYHNNIELDGSVEKHVLYIGKADLRNTKTKTQNGLKKRIKEYVKIVFGGSSHRGGIDIFAVQDYEKYLHIEWFKLDPRFDTAEDMESNEIDCFKQTHQGNLPVANRKDGNKRR